MSTHIRTWGIALAAITVFAIPTLVTQAGTASVEQSFKAATPAAVSTATMAVQTIPAIQKTMDLRITAYTSLTDETDNTPFITADGSYVHDGIIASNLLPFGTKVMIPSLFGDKVFTVHDSTSKKFSNSVDIWMATKGAAVVFGVHTADVVVLANADQTGTNAVTEATAINSKLQDQSVRQL